MLKKLPRAYYRFVGWDKIDIFDKSKKRRIADVGNRRFSRAYVLGGIATEHIARRASRIGRRPIGRLKRGRAYVRKVALPPST